MGQPAMNKKQGNLKDNNLRENLHNGNTAVTKIKMKIKTDRALERKKR